MSLWNGLPMRRLAVIISCVADGRRDLNARGVETKLNHGRQLGATFIADIAEVRFR
jgi:hypothetical protein